MFTYYNLQPLRYMGLWRKNYIVCLTQIDLIPCLQPCEIKNYMVNNYLRKNNKDYTVFIYNVVTL